MGATNCPETPRQKMINMMYLVLMAMLAMNVSAEVLVAFRVVNSSLVETYNAVEYKVNRQYSDLETAYHSEDSIKVKASFEKAKVVRAKVQELQQYVTNLKVYMVEEKGGGVNISKEEDYEYDPERSYIVNNDGDSIEVSKDDDLNIPSEVMIGEKKASELKNKIDELKTQLLNIAKVPEGSVMAKNIESSLSTDIQAGRKDPGDGAVTWETLNFADQPMIASLTLLSKIQIDIANAELSLLSWLHSQIDANLYKFNTLDPIVSTRSTTILQGDTYRAEIFLAARDSTSNVKVLVDENQLPNDNTGKAIYEASANSVGAKKWSGIIEFESPDGKPEYYNVGGEYLVVQPSATVSPTKMNVFYMNIANPISVSVPGMAAKDVRVTMSNGRIENRGGETVVFPASEDLTGKKTAIYVDAMVSGKQTRVATLAFRVKKVPDPVAQVAGKNGGILRKENMMAEQGVFAELIDFDFDLKFKVMSFDVTMIGNGGYNVTFKSNSARFTPEMKEAISKQQVNSVIYIDNIQARGDDNTTRSLRPVSFKLQ